MLAPPAPACSPRPGEEEGAHVLLRWQAGGPKAGTRGHVRDRHEQAARGFALPHAQSTSPPPLLLHLSSDRIEGKQELEGEDTEEKEKETKNLPFE